jgi:hypothetical protein
MADYKFVQKKYGHHFNRKRKYEGKVEPTFASGKITVPSVVPGTPDLEFLDVLLTGFDIDWFELEDQHKTWLHDEGMKFVKQDFEKRVGQGGPVVVNIDGYASHTYKGSEDESAEHNEILSQLRAKEVQNYIDTYVAMYLNKSYIKYNPNWHGFNDPPVPGKGEYRKHRSVRLVLQRPGLAAPKPVTISDDAEERHPGPWRLISLAGQGINVPVPGTPASVGTALKTMVIGDLAPPAKYYTYDLPSLNASLGYKLPGWLGDIIKAARDATGFMKGTGALKGAGFQSTNFISNPLRYNPLIAAGPINQRTFAHTVIVHTLEAGLLFTSAVSVVIITNIENSLVENLNPMGIHGIFLTAGGDFGAGLNASTLKGQAFLRENLIKSVKIQKAG